MLILSSEEQEQVETQLGKLLELSNKFQDRGALAVNDSSHLKDLTTCCTISAQLIIELYQRLGSIMPNQPSSR
jgi:hypothetical protein